MAAKELKAAILVISTTASSDPSTDKTTPLLRDVFNDPKNTKSGPWSVFETAIVPDDIVSIQAAVKQLCDREEPVNVIVTSGGTGFATKDFTPEAVTPLIHRHAPGLIHGMLASSLSVTPFAMMSRPVAGVRNKTLILTLPGSPKGAKENLEAVIKLLPHACTQAEGADSRTMHSAGVESLEKEAGFGSVVGHVLASDITAAESVPAFRASIVDGYAISIPDGSESNSKGIFPVSFASHAQADKGRSLKEAEISRITTGAALPKGADAVVMVEDTILKSRTADGNEESEVEILTDAVKSGENVREIGSDVEIGSTIMRKGEGISATGGEFGLLASVGTMKVDVYKKPIIGILSTGDEIIPHDLDKSLSPGEVRDTNRPTLLTCVQAQGFEVVDLGIASDKMEHLESTVRKSLTQVDVLITTGGVSMGELDLLKPTLERSLGGTIHFGRVSMKPGKPTTFATVPSENIKDPGAGSRGSESWERKVVFSLPGNPASAVVTFMIFVLPALHLMSGIQPVGLPKISVMLDSMVKCDPVREEYHRVLVSMKNNHGGGSLYALSTGGQRSSRIGSFKGANALVKLPAGGGTFEKGRKVDALMMGPIGGVADIV